MLDKTNDNFLLDSYSGQGGYADGRYLIAHARELPAKLAQRKALAVYPNYCRKIVDVYLGFLWRQAPQREVSDLYNQFAINSDGLGGAIDSVLFGYQRLALVLGTVYVLVDKPQNIAQSRADEKQPYLAVRTPQALVRELKNHLGEWELVTFSEVDLTSIRTPLSPVAVLRYRTYTRTGWILSRDIYATDIIEQGEYPLGKVPVVKLHAAKPLNPNDSRAQSWAYDLACLNWDLYNLRSELRELFRAQTFSILAMPVVDDQERERLKDVTISTENALSYNPAGGGVPTFVAPPADPVELYMKQIAETVQDIYRVANLEFVGGVQQSGVALSFHFQEANSSLRGMAEQCETAEREIAHLVHLWQGQVFDGHIAYSNDFNLTDLASALAVAMDAVNLNMGTAFDVAVKKRVARQILGSDTPPSVLSEIDREIEALGDTYGDRLAQQAGL